MSVKVCSKCKVEKDETDFHLAARYKSGRQSRCKACRSEQAKHIYQKDTLKINQRNKKWATENIEEKRAKGRAYYYRNKEKYRINSRSYNPIRNARKIERKKADPVYKLIVLQRNRIHKIFKAKGFSKRSKGLQMLGCSASEAKKHIESKFLPGMSWSNHGLWHIDHIVPLASAIDEESLLPLLHYTNLQPLWAIDNIKKGARVV